MNQSTAQLTETDAWWKPRPGEHRVRPGESLLSIARDHGLLPEKVWRCDENAPVRDEHSSPDRLAPGDCVIVPEFTPRKETVETEKRHVFKTRRPLGVWIRLEIDPDDAASLEDRFVLSSSDGSYRSEKTVRDDLVPGDEYTDLFFSGLSRGKSYELRVHSSGEQEDGDADEEGEILFEDVPYAELERLSPQAGVKA